MSEHPTYTRRHYWLFAKMMMLYQFSSPQNKMTTII